LPASSTWTPRSCRSHSFTEETQAYVYGREEELAELGRRVQRKLLTILFGQSGLGKTSILRAGIVPRLRPMGYCPVYVRIDCSALRSSCLQPWRAGRESIQDFVPALSVGTIAAVLQ
jgi:hypothetical protein